LTGRPWAKKARQLLHLMASRGYAQGRFLARGGNKWEDWTCPPGAHPRIAHLSMDPDIEAMIETLLEEIFE